MIEALKMTTRSVTKMTCLHHCPQNFGLEQKQAKADVAKLRAEAKAFQSIIASKDDQWRSKDAVIESKVEVLQAKESEIKTNRERHRP